MSKIIFLLRFRGILVTFRGFKGILLILNCILLILKVLRGIIVILLVLGVIWLFSRFLGYFRHLWCILVIWVTLTSKIIF